MSETESEAVRRIQRAGDKLAIQMITARDDTAVLEALLHDAITGMSARDALVMLCGVAVRLSGVVGANGTLIDQATAPGTFDRIVQLFAIKIAQAWEKEGL